MVPLWEPARWKTSTSSTPNFSVTLRLLPNVPIHNRGCCWRSLTKQLLTRVCIEKICSVFIVLNFFFKFLKHLRTKLPIYCRPNNMFSLWDIRSTVKLWRTFNLSPILVRHVRQKFAAFKFSKNQYKCTTHYINEVQIYIDLY